jgi:hypothetical protein
MSSRSDLPIGTVTFLFTDVGRLSRTCDCKRENNYAAHAKKHVSSSIGAVGP